MIAPLVEARGLSAGYGDTTVVRDVTLQVAAGEIVALLGANGAGKTSTMLALVGELRRSAGDVLWDGEQTDLALHQRARNGLAFVPEERSVFASLTTQQNIALGRGCDASRVFSLFPELAGLKTRRGGLLSGGEQQMLSVGRALARPTRLLLADELSMGLAPRTVGRILRAIRSAADDGLGALIIEQHVHRVLDVADRVYLMQSGRVAFTATAAEARDRLAEIQQHYLTKHVETR